MGLAESYKRGFGEITICDERGSHSSRTFTCAHCNRIVHFDSNPVYDEKGPPLCLKEWLPICIPCHRKNECQPFEKKLDHFEKHVNTQLARDRFYKSLGI